MSDFQTRKFKISPLNLNFPHEKQIFLSKISNFAVNFGQYLLYWYWSRTVLNIFFGTGAGIDWQIPVLTHLYYIIQSSMIRHTVWPKKMPTLTDFAVS
jgi:hypothetical protein